MSLLIIIVATLILTILYCGYMIIRNLSIYFRLQLKIRQPLPIQATQWLNQQFHYYQQLNVKDKERFRKHVQKFIVLKEYTSKSTIPTTDLQRLKIAACVAQITHGYPNALLYKFKKILLYPKAFLSPHTKQLSKGEVAMGFIVLSLADFDKGYEIPNDGINVGLHEMAHALLLENASRKSKYKFIQKQDLDALYIQFKTLSQNIITRKDPIIRPYAANNFHEFFAVTVELFFEKPNELKQIHPKVYALMVNILRQDLTN